MKSQYEKSPGTAYARMRESVGMEGPMAPGEDANDELFGGPEEIVNQFEEDFKDDLIESLRAIARSGGEFDRYRDDLINRLEGVLRNSHIRDLTAQVLVGKGDIV